VAPSPSVRLAFILIRLVTYPRPFCSVAFSRSVHTVQLDSPAAARLFETVFLSSPCSVCNSVLTPSLWARLSCSFNPRFAVLYERERLLILPPPYSAPTFFCLSRCDCALHHPSPSSFLFFTRGGFPLALDPLPPLTSACFLPRSLPLFDVAWLPYLNRTSRFARRIHAHTALFVILFFGALAFFPRPSPRHSPDASGAAHWMRVDLGPAAASASAVPSFSQRVFVVHTSRLFGKAAADFPILLFFAPDSFPGDFKLFPQARVVLTFFFFEFGPHSSFLICSPVTGRRLPERRTGPSPRRNDFVSPPQIVYASRPRSIHGDRFFPMDFGLPTPVVFSSAPFSSYFGRDSSHQKVRDVADILIAQDPAGNLTFHLRSQKKQVLPKYSSTRVFGHAF